MRILILFIVLGSVCHAELRTWTSIVGTKVEAELVSLTGNQVTLKTKAGKTIKLPLNKLSKADQEFLTAKSSPKEPTKEETPVNPNLKYEVKDSVVTITGCDKKASGELTIPATIEGNPVTSIGKEAFRKCMELTSITIPDSVTTIGKSAFSQCHKLTSITIPDSVTSIGEYAFYGANLTNITIGDSVMSIGSAAFNSCNSLTSIKIGAGNVNYTDVNGVLFNAEKTVLLTYPASKEGANYTIPDSVTSIGERAFSGCRSLASITIPDGVTSIGKSAFSYCTNLTSITIPDSVTSIGENAFSLCSSLTNITIPKSVTSIGINAFQSCTSLKSVTFLGDAPKSGYIFFNSFPTIYRKPEAKGWGDKWSDKPVKLISEKP